MAQKTVGKSAGWGGPVEEYTRNKGSVGKKKVVFVGASYKFVHRVVRDMLLVGGFNECEIVIHDIDEAPLKLVGDLVERMARQRNTKIAVTRTLDRRAALQGADAVLLSITTGGQEADFRAFECCARYGIPVGIGDTMGPAALARNLREIPVVVEIVRHMEKLCPKAALLNFTNPMSCITGAAARYSSIPTYGLCHSGDALRGYFAEIFGVRKGHVEMEIGGVNHQAFVTKLWINGKDRTHDLLDASLKSRAKIADTLMGTAEEVDLQRDVYRVLHAWPSCGGNHLAEFYNWFFTPRRVGMLGDHALKRVIPGRQPFGRREPHPILHEWAYGPEPVGDMHLLTNEHAHELMWAHFTGEPYTRVLNVLNGACSVVPRSACPTVRDGSAPHSTVGRADRGTRLGRPATQSEKVCIQGLPRDACVEIIATVKGRKLAAKPITLPPAVHSLVQRWVTIHELSIQAAMRCDRDAAHQALFLDPHVQDLYDIPALLDDFLRYLAPWLPRGWGTR
jgi:alpha-galactosidase